MLSQSRRPGVRTAGVCTHVTPCLLSDSYGQLYVLFLRHHSRASSSAGAEVVLYHLPRYVLRPSAPGGVGTEAVHPSVTLCPHREGACKKTHILKLGRTGKFALNVVDNLVVVHHQDTEVGAGGRSGSAWRARLLERVNKACWTQTRKCLLC